MKRSEFLRQALRLCAQSAASIALLVLLSGSSRAQTPAPTQPAPDAVLQELNNKYPGLLPEIGRLFARLQSEIHFPEPRSESRILPLLPETTVMYGAIPNYGDAAHQTLEILRAELKESAVLRDFIQKTGEWPELEPKIEDSLGKLWQLHEYLGNEIVFSGVMTGRAPALLMAAEIRKPGLKDFLQKNLGEISPKSKPGVRVFDAQGLAAAESKGHSDDLMVLVRTDFVLAASDLTTLRNFNARLDQHGDAGASVAEFKERVAREYAGGVTILGSADLHRLMSRLPPGAKQSESPLQRSGFGDVNYLVWDRRSADGQATSQAELSFLAPRQGAAAWLANTRPLTTLGFVSPKAMMAATIALRNPAQMFDDIRGIAGTADQNAFAALAQFESMFKLTVKDDVLANLDGELTLELDDVRPPKPTWRAIFKVKDAAHLQQTFNTLLAATHFETQHTEDGGVTFNTLQIPRAKPAETTSAPATYEIGYAFADGHLIVGSGRDAVAEAVRLHRTGESLEKSPTLLAAVPPGHSLEASAMFFQDPAAMWSLELRRLAPGLADAAVKLLGQSAPSVVGVYADDTAIREASRSGGLDVTTALIVAAVAIPNLLRSRIAANEASAVGGVRTINVAEITYQVAYPKRGYAPSLGKLGPNHADPEKPTPEHADLIDDSLTTEDCSADGWCSKSGYRFNLKAMCKLNVCSEYVVTATPVSGKTGTRSFCSTSDAVVRAKAGSDLLDLPLTAAECKKWERLQ